MKKTTWCICYKYKDITLIVLRCLPVTRSPLMKLSQSSNSRSKWLYRSRVVTPRRLAERHRDSCLCQWSHGGEWRGTEWHTALRPAEVTARLERARNSACWESERVLYITECSDNTRGCHYHNPDTRQKCHVYRGCNPLIRVGWEMCVGHKCLWRGDTVKTEWNVKYVEYQTWIPNAFTIKHVIVLSGLT